MLSSPALRQRLADLLTDTSRAQVLRALGYQVEVIEFIDSRHTPRNTAIRARPQSRPGRTEVIKAQLEHAELLRTWAVEPSLDRLLAAELAEDLAGA
jgi:selenocysteine lyase/cysteine desulfurase